MTKRPIAPIKIVGVVAEPPRGARPEITWMAPTDIRVDESYQRGIGERRRKLIANIYGNFDWRLWRLPICVWTEEGLEAIDGQHGLIAAASLGVAEVPIMIVEAAELENRADLFVSVNKDRLALTPLQLHAAKVLAGDADAVRLGVLCSNLGIRLLRATPAEGRYKPRETMAVSCIASLLNRYAEVDVEKILRTVANTDAAPISVVMIRATELLLTDPEFMHEVDPEIIAAGATSLPDLGLQEARLFAATHSVPQWRALASVWFKASKKVPKRSTPKSASVPAEPAYVLPPAPDTKPSALDAPMQRAAPSTFGLRPSYEPAGYSFGDPEPGRSALDQRRAQQEMLQ